MSHAVPVVAPPGFFPPPPGVTPNFIDPVQRTAGLVPLICIFVPLATLFLGLRLYTKARIIRLVGWEDVIIIVAWLFNLVFMGCLLLAWKLGNGAHMWDITKDNYIKFTEGLAAGAIIYVPAVALPKVSILFFYLRLNPAQSFRYSVFAVMAITIGYTIALMLVLLFPCHPVEKLWQPFRPDGHCLELKKIYLANPIINTAVDILVLLLPIPMLVKLQVNTRTKFLLFLIFTVCSCTVVISAIRIWAVTVLLEEKDFTWHTDISDALAVCELNLTIICGSILTLRPFCRKHLPFLLSGSRTKRPSHETPDDKKEIALNFDGPRGPNSKSGYMSKVSGGHRSHSNGYPKHQRSKRSLWSGFGSTLVKEDDDDLESLGAELRDVAPHVRVGGLGTQGGRGLGAYKGGESRTHRGGVENYPPNDEKGSEIGVVRDLYTPDQVHLSRGEESSEGIVKTVSLDVR